MAHRAQAWIPRLVLMELGFSATEAQAMSDTDRDIIFEAAQQLAQLRKKKPKNTIEM